MVPVKVRANAVLRWDNSHCQVSIPIPKPMPKWGIIKYARLGSKGNRSELAPIMQSASVTRNHLDETRKWTITTHPIHSLTQSACTLTGNAGECRTCWKCSCQSDSLCCREWKQLLRSILIYEYALGNAITCPFSISVAESRQWAKWAGTIRAWTWSPWTRRWSLP